MMGRQVNLHTFLDFSHQHCVVPSAVRLVQPTAGTNQDTAATVAAASAASTFVDPAFTIAVSVPAFVASATASATLLLLPLPLPLLPLSCCWQMP